MRPATGGAILGVFVVIIIVIIVAAVLPSASSFQSQSSTRYTFKRNGRRRCIIISLHSTKNDNDDNDMERLVPETAFGAEIVPEGQRPVNEYLEMKNAPLFGWASEETGSKGVSAFIFFNCFLLLLCLLVSFQLGMRLHNDRLIVHHGRMPHIAKLMLFLFFSFCWGSIYIASYSVRYSLRCSFCNNVSI